MGSLALVSAAEGTLSWEPADRHTELLADPVAAAVASTPSARVAAIDPTLADTAAFCAAYGSPPEHSANCVVVAGKRAGEVRYAAVLVLASARADINGAVRRHLDVRKISFAPQDDAVSLTGMEFGGITPDRPARRLAGARRRGRGGRRGGRHRQRAASQQAPRAPRPSWPPCRRPRSSPWPSDAPAPTACGCPVGVGGWRHRPQGAAMSEPSSGVPGEIADADVETPEAQDDQPEQVTLDVDEDKLEAWDDIKADYQVDPGGQPVPNSTEAPDMAGDDEGDGRTDDVEGTSSPPG